MFTLEGAQAWPSPANGVHLQGLLKGRQTAMHLQGQTDCWGCSSFSTFQAAGLGGGSGGGVKIGSPAIKRAF